MLNTIFVIFSSIIITFIIPRLAPGDPVDILQMTYGLSPEEADVLRARLGLKGSILQQFIGYLNNLIKGDLGPSFTYNMVPVTDVIMRALPWSLFLLTMAISIRVVLGILLGIFSALRYGKKTDVTISLSIAFIMAMPYFTLALILLYVLSVQFNIFPLAHAYSGYNEIMKSFSFQYIGDILYHAALPIITLVIAGLPGTYNIMRNNMSVFLDADFVTLLKAEGFSGWKVTVKVARNAILPVITSTAISFGYMVVGAVITESIFSYPGMGYVLLTAISNKDYPLIQGVFLLLAITISLANFISDILYAFFDPRVELK
jgi:peptide/nickel transport system permease protein